MLKCHRVVGGVEEHVNFHLHSHLTLPCHFLPNALDTYSRAQQETAYDMTSLMCAPALIYRVYYNSVLCPPTLAIMFGEPRVSKYDSFCNYSSNFIGKRAIMRRRTSVMYASV